LPEPATPRALRPAPRARTFGPPVGCLRARGAWAEASLEERHELLERHVSYVEPGESSFGLAFTVALPEPIYLETIYHERELKASDTITHPSEEAVRPYVTTRRCP
jgi:hypothetical protein